jgi:DNA-binding beta-propeller fold protein YncE
MSTKQSFQHVAVYGQTAQQDHTFAGPVPEDFTLNSPVGCCMDREQRVWLCDTGNDRVLVLDKTLTRIIRVLRCPQPGAKGEGGVDFRMPFHLAQHPQQDRMYITDMGNSRVVVMDYTKDKIHFSHVFGNSESNGGAPLQDPNGITIVRDKHSKHSKHDKNDKYFVHVNDEFFHNKTDPMRNRCVRYTDNGEYVDEFRTVQDPDGTLHDLYWPQGLSSDTEGNLYIANTGSYEILKCSATAKIGPHYGIEAEAPVVQYRFGQPCGIGTMNIMRYVTVIGKHVFVPDHILNTISVFDLKGRQQATLCGIRPSWNHGNEPVHSLTDPIYYSEEDSMLLNPYVICQGEREDVYFVTEPFSSRLIKLHIPQLEGISPPMSMMAALGARRDQVGKHGSDPQFNCVTAVGGLKAREARLEHVGHHGQIGHASWPSMPQLPLGMPDDLPAWLKFNPLQQWYMAASAMATAQYQFWVGNMLDHALAHTPAAHKIDAVRLNLDAGNWRIKAYLEEGEQFNPVRHNILNGYFLPGNLAIAVYYPKTALLGQICPDTPILLIDNFNLGVVSLYQVGPGGQWLNYGIPFGGYGQGPGNMRGPQGMAVTDEGEVFIVDSLNNRMVKWQILQTGQVVFIDSFVWAGKGAKDEVFTPTDVALDAKKRLFVTDQFNNRVCVFDHHGQSLWCYGKQGYWEQGQPDGERFMLPTSLAIDGELLILNDLVNRALKLFRIEEHGLKFLGGISLFKLTQQQGGVWMPYFMYAHEHQVFIADSTYNIVQVYRY